MIRVNQVVTNLCVPGCAALVFVLMVAASLNGQVSGENMATELARPAGVPQEYVITPFGYFHPSCVLGVAEGETILADGRIQHASGAIERNAPVCRYAHYTATGARLGADMRDTSGAVAPVISGWLEYVSATTSSSYAEISATWMVPAPPGTYHGQTVFFFPGFEDVNNVLSIVQPVLQFGRSAAGGGNYWALSSWNCCLSGISWHSGLVRTSPGNSILGTITPSCKKSGNCTTWTVLTKDATTGKKSTLRKTPADGQVWNWGFGAVLEVYGVSQCSDFPADNSLTFTVRMYDQNRNLIPDPGWIGTPAGSGISPQCNYGLNVTPTQETLQY